MEDLDVRRVIASPEDEVAAQVKATHLGLPLQVHDLIPKGTAFIFDPTRLFDQDDEDWPLSVGRIDFSE